MKLYLSSTLSDLETERDAVKEALSGRYLIIESYEANPRPLWQSCITDVQDCDLYVGIIGLRYGFVPPEQSKSITELEFDAAFSKGLDCYLFLKDADHIPATHTDSHRGENQGGECSKAFRARLQSGAGNVPRPAQFTDAADLKVKVLRALPPAIVDNAVPPDAPDALPAPPADATELQRMLHRHLHEHWPVLSQSTEFCRAAVFEDVPPPLTAAKVFTLAREGEVDHLLVWTPEYFRDTRGAVWHTADAGSRHGVVCGALLRVVLVAAERHVLGAGTTLADADDPVLETNAADTIGYVKAAACLGFGLCFLPGNDEPANVFRLRHPVAEFGNRGEEGPALTNAELWAAIERKTSTDPGKDFTVGYLRQQIKRLAKLMGTGLVAVAVPEGRFADPGARAQLRAHLQTFDLKSFFLRQQCSAMPGWLQQVENDLRDAFAPIFSRASADTPPTPAAGDRPA